MSEITLTDAGRIILAKAVAGRPLKFLRVSCGDGFLDENQDIKKIEELKHELYDLKIYSCKIISSQGIAELQTLLSNKDIKSGFYVREIGIFVEDPDTGKEILYGYYNFSDESDYMPAHGGIDDVEFLYKFYIAIEQAKNITVNDTSGFVYVTQEELNDIFDESAPVQEFWTRTEGDDKKLRPLDIQQVRVAVMGIQNLNFLQKQINEVSEANIQNAVTFYSELEKNKNTDSAYNHEELEGLLGGNQAGHFHLTQEQYISLLNGTSHEELKGLLGGNQSGHYHLTQEQYISLLNGISHEALKNLLGGTANNHYHLTQAQLNKLENISTESWTFTLEDGSMVVKNVHIS